MLIKASAGNKNSMVVMAKDMITSVNLLLQVVTLNKVYNMIVFVDCQIHIVLTITE